MLFLFGSLSVLSVGRTGPFVLCEHVYASCSPLQSPPIWLELCWLFSLFAKPAVLSLSFLVANISCIHNDSLSSRCCYYFPAHHSYCHMAWFCALNVPSVDLVLSLLFAWQMPAQLASPEEVGCRQPDSRTSEQAAFQTDAEELALPSALGKKRTNVNPTLNS